MQSPLPRPAQQQQQQQQGTAPSVAQVAEQCFADLERDAAVTGQVSDEHLARLALLLGRNWVKAMQVVDKGAVQCFQAEGSGRRVFQVHGRSGDYITMPRHYCSCQAFFYEVVGKAEAVYCKHQLAAQLALALRRCAVVPVSDAALAEILLQS